MPGGRFFAQRLRHRVDIEALSVDIDDSNTNGNGAQQEDFRTIRADEADPLFAAEIVALRGDELIAAAAINGEIATRITINYPATTIIPSMRVRHGSTLYDIKAVLPDPTERRALQLLATTGTNEG